MAPGYQCDCASKDSARPRLAAHWEIMVATQTSFHPEASAGEVRPRPQRNLGRFEVQHTCVA